MNREYSEAGEWGRERCVCVSVCVGGGGGSKFGLPSGTVGTVMG